LRVDYSREIDSDRDGLTTSAFQGENSRLHRSCDVRFDQRHWSSIVIHGTSSLESRKRSETRYKSAFCSERKASFTKSSTNLWESQSSTGWFMLDDVIESVRTVIGDIDGMDPIPIRGIVEVKSRRCNLRKERREEKGIGQSLARQEVLESSSNSL
jgi:hypothetical protein